MDLVRGLQRGARLGSAGARRWPPNWRFTSAGCAAAFLEPPSSGWPSWSVVSLVLALAAAYIRLGGLPWMQGMFYGIGAAVIAIIGRSASNS